MKKVIKTSLTLVICFIIASVLVNLTLGRTSVITLETLIYAAIFFVFESAITAYRNYKSSKKDLRSLVVAAECSDEESAGTVCSLLEKNKISSMIVQPGCPIYIDTENGGSQIQVQIFKKDKKKADKILNNNSISSSRSQDIAAQP